MHSTRPFVSPNRRHDKQRFHKYVTAETAITILSSRALRWSAPSCFNDPFDVPREAMLGFDVAELQAAILDVMVAVLEGRLETKDPRLCYLAGAFQANANAEGHRAVLSELRRSTEEIAPSNTTALELFRQVWREEVPLMRILCLSEVPDCMPMWAHYSENHTGAVLTLRVADELDSSLLLAQPVIYSDMPPALPSKEVWARSIVRGDAVDWQEWFKEYHYVKTTQWREEQEWRVISRVRPGETGLYSHWPFHIEELSEVILGASMSRQNQEDIIALLRANYPHAEVYRAAINSKARRLDFARIREVVDDKGSR